MLCLLRNGVERICRAFTDPLIVYPPEDPGLIPEDLKTQITVERLAQNMKAGYDGRIEEATDSEALLYLMTASLAAPFNQEWYRIHSHLFGKYAERQGLQLPDDLREDAKRFRQLDDYHLSQLKELKRWIERQKDRAYREGRKLLKSEEPERTAQQLTLDLYAEELRETF